MAAYDLIAVYIIASKRNGTLYTGVTSDLIQRGYEHRSGRFGGFPRSMDASSSFGGNSTKT